MLINRLAAKLMVLMSLSALILVLYAFILPEADDGTAAHLFQFLILGLVPVGLTFVTTTNGSQGTFRTLLLTAVMVALAFGGLYYRQHYYYVGY